MVKAALSPLSWTMEHEEAPSHIVPSSARPSVSHFCRFGLRQMFSLQTTISFIRTLIDFIENFIENFVMQKVPIHFTSIGPLSDQVEFNWNSMNG